MTLYRGRVQGEDKFWLIEASLWTLIMLFLVAFWLPLILVRWHFWFG